MVKNIQVCDPDNGSLSLEMIFFAATSIRITAVVCLWA
jgi:hypothetical protein